MFCEDFNATLISHISSLNRNTLNHYIDSISERIVEICELDSQFKGEVEIDESYFGPRHQKGKRGRGVSGKTIVFDI